MYRDFLSSGEQFGAFFEDDAVLSDSLPQFLKSYVSSAGFGYELLRLDHAPRVRLFPAVATSPQGSAIHEFRSTLAGTAGYLLSRSAAGRLLDYPGWGETQFDLALYDPFQAPGNLVSRALVNPALVVQFASRGEVRNNAGIGLSDIDPPARSASRPSYIERLKRVAPNGVSSLIKGVSNAVDHLWNIPKGLKATRVYFKGDSPYCS